MERDHVLSISLDYCTCSRDHEHFRPLSIVSSQGKKLVATDSTEHAKYNGDGMGRTHERLGVGMDPDEILAPRAAAEIPPSYSGPADDAPLRSRDHQYDKIQRHREEDEE